MSISPVEIDNMKTFDANYSPSSVDKKEVKSLTNDINKLVENGISVQEDKRVNGVIEHNGKNSPSKMNGEVMPIEHEEIDEEKLLNDGSSDDCVESANDDLLNSDEDTKKKNDNKQTENDSINDKVVSENDKVVSENDKVVSETVEHLKEEILKSENEDPTNENGNDIEGMEVEEIFKNKEQNENEIELVESGDEIIPSPIEVNKHMRVSDQLNKISKLHEDLRCEEAKLALLRKLVDSQRGKSIYKSKHQSPMPSLHTKQQISSKVNLPPKQNTISGKPSQPVQKYYIQVGNQLVPAPPPSTTTQGGSSPYQFANGNSSSQPSFQQPQSKAPPAPPKQTPEQKQNAAKAALRRQLEQTLLQIPPPRPPPADWKVVPNVNSMDFMMLVGLDEVVDLILDLDSKPTLKAALEELPMFNPRICSQCNVDFSPCWKLVKNKDQKGLVLCERCSLQNVKKELKAEHTTRLKSAFLKALKQEQEIEEKIKAGEDVNLSNITGDKTERNAPSPQQAARISSPKTGNATSQAVVNHTASPTESRPHHQSSSNSHHHRHQVVQHYPHHNSLVQQLHHQHIQQQQIELEPPPPSSSSHHSSRWHPYMPSSSSHHQHREHHNVHHRSYPANSSENNPHQEYYVVHHPQHAGVRYVNR